MQLGYTFDATAVPESDDEFAPLPAGWYTASINQAEVKQTKAGNGSYINIRYDITGPTHQGRVVFGMITLENNGPNKEKAESIGRQQLGQIVRAIGLNQISDTDELIGGNLQIKLGIEKNEEYGDKNNVKGFKSVAGNPAPFPSNQPPAQTESRPPWMK